MQTKKEQKKRAIILGALKKWAGICCGSIPPKRGVEPCGLCYEYRDYTGSTENDYGCDKCPLAIFGYPCIQKSANGGPWNQYRAAYRIARRSWMVPTEQRLLDLKTPAFAMYEVICELCIEHDIDIDADGFEKELCEGS